MSKPLTLYKNILRSVQQAFRGDAAAIQNARAEARRQFLASRSVTDREQLDTLLAQAEEMAEFIKVNVVQSPLNTRGNFEIYPDAREADVYAEEAALRPALEKVHPRKLDKQ